MNFNENKSKNSTAVKTKAKVNWKKTSCIFSLGFDHTPHTF